MAHTIHMVKYTPAHTIIPLSISDAVSVGSYSYQDGKR